MDHSGRPPGDQRAETVVLVGVVDVERDQHQVGLQRGASVLEPRDLLNGVEPRDAGVDRPVVEPCPGVFVEKILQPCSEGLPVGYSIAEGKRITQAEDAKFAGRLVVGDFGAAPTLAVDVVLDSGNRPAGLSVLRNPIEIEVEKAKAAAGNVFTDASGLWDAARALDAPRSPDADGPPHPVFENLHLADRRCPAIGSRQADAELHQEEAHGGASGQKSQLSAEIATSSAVHESKD
jgi:hypothetical protein